MVAFPFQSWPSLSEYCEWFESEGGCVEPINNQWGNAKRLISSDGKRYVHVSELEEEVIGPAKLKEIEARLGIKSPWTPKFDGE